MPELPEVETICRGLRPLVTGRRVAEVEVLQPRLRVPVSEDFCSKLQGKIILGVERKGKYLLTLLEGEAVWISHLGMSGKLIYVERDRPRETHDHILVRLDNGHELRFNDPRRFGLSVIFPVGQLTEWAPLRELGPDPLDRQFNGDYLYSVARGSLRRVRDLLIDQRVVAGLGNIYANEILFRVGIRPTTRAWKLGRDRAGKIAKLTPRLLREAIRWCGTSFSDYRDAEDRFGEFQNHLRVYDREGETCEACASEIKRVALGNRSAFYCPRCHK